ncbi:glycosyltransferase family 4 protein [Gramella aestuarii]|uniref:Glycosyltransferase family 4 protein n=2 Tax=Christiangramia aestuarii TaxID=1028746 RepID=A0A7K1LLT1_9FLAO|nr:glycosyltransferase family 4 protein [Christiangramia aestuarii]
MVSIFAPHFFNWTEQLKDSGHEIYWLDVFDSNTKVEKIDFVNQVTGWRYKWDYPGRYLLKRKTPNLTKLINIFNERDFQKTLKTQIEKIEPDIVHSFVIYLSAAPSLSIMESFPGLKWIVSTWGSDIFYYRNKPSYLRDIRNVLSRVDYLFTDCKRDLNIAIQNGFKGEFLGVFPGGGGYDFTAISKSIKKFEERDLILIKGYQGLHGRCIEVLNALQLLKERLVGYRVIVYGAGKEVIEFAEVSKMIKWSNFKIFGKISHTDVLELMGQAKIAIGNSLSDGIPNTLLEAIIMEAFPVQSNPGNATSEIILDGVNGILLEEPENVNLIQRKIELLLNKELDLKKAVEYNSLNVKPCLERKKVQNEVLERYSLIENQLEEVNKSN